MAAADASPRVSAAQLLRDIRMPLCEPFNVQLIDYGLVPRRAWRPIIIPRRGEIGDTGQWRKGGGIALGIEHRIVPNEIPRNNLGVGIEQNLARIEAMPT